MSDGTQISQWYSGLIAKDYFVHLLEQKKNLGNVSLLLITNHERIEKSNTHTKQQTKKFRS